MQTLWLYWSVGDRKNSKKGKQKKDKKEKMSKIKYLGIAGASSIALFFLFGVPTAMIPNPFFIRMTPVSWYDWLVLILTSLLAGTYIGLYYYKKQQQTTKAACTATSGTFLGFFSYGCAICNKLLVFLLGFTGVITYFMPVQPYIGVLSIFLLSYGLFSLWRT